MDARENLSLKDLINDNSNSDNSFFSDITLTPMLKSLFKPYINLGVDSSSEP